MHGGVDHDGVRESASQTVDGLLPPVGGAVVDDPEDACGAGVGLLGHDLGDQVHERHDAGGGFAAAEDVRLVDVVGRQVGEGTASFVLVVDAHGPGLPGCQGRVAAAAGLDR